jgi:hypothetical protein
MVLVQTASPASGFRPVQNIFHQVLMTRVNELSATDDTTIAPRQQRPPRDLHGSMR